MKLRKSPRLKDFDYVGPFAYSLTLITRDRAHVFTNPRTVNTTLDCLGRSCDRYSFSLHAYCFMPDHLHLMISGNDRASLQHFVRHFKQLSSHRYKREHGARLWQISYYDHVLRTDEDLPDVAQYIWHNPIRGGLARDRSEYPFSGSMMEQA